MNSGFYYCLNFCNHKAFKVFSFEFFCVCNGTFVTFDQFDRYLLKVLHLSTIKYSNSIKNLKNLVKIRSIFNRK